MTDLANYSVTETLRDGRTIEPRAAFPEGQSGLAPSHRTPAEP